MSAEHLEDGEPFVSIRAKLIAASSVLLVGTMLLYGYVAYHSARAALLPSIREQLADDAYNVKGGLEEMLTAHWRNVQMWAQLPVMREIEHGDRDGGIARFLALSWRGYGVYLEVLALDAKGDCVASSDATGIGVHHAGVPTTVDGDERPTFEVSERHSATGLRLSAPIVDPDRPGRRIGTVIALLDRQVLDRIVVSKPGHSQIELRLFDQNEQLIAGRTPPLKISRVREWQVDEKLPDEVPTLPPALLREGSDENGRGWLVAKVPVGARDGLPTPGWHLTAAVPKDVVLTPVTALRSRVLATGTVLILAGLLATVVFANRMSAPIKALTAVASRIATSGDLEVVPPTRSRDEVGQLATAFRRMVNALDVANDEMVRSSKLAFLGEMAAGMAHEIRTPLGIIRSSAQLIERRMQAVGDAEVTRWAVFIREESDRLERVVSDLLDFVKPLPPQISRNDLADIVRRSVQMLSSEAAGRGIEVEVVDHATPVVVPCDADQIHQVCLNLLLNALQASPKGGRVWISLATRGDRGEIVVRDNGRGIPRDVADRMFEPFTSRRDGGIGLGLAIVRRIARAHGGEVSARNRRRGGAEFVVSLPLAESPASVATS